MSPSEMILFNRVDHDDHSGLRNPLVKLVSIGGPLALVVYQQVGRSLAWPVLGLRELLLIAVFLLVAVTLNFAQRDRTRTARRVAVSVLIIIGIFYASTNPKSPFTTALGFVSSGYKLIPILGEIQPQSWLYFIFIYIAYKASHSLTSRDLLWLGRHFLWRPAFIVYTVCVTTGAVIFSILPLRLSLSWRIALDKGNLLRNPDVVSVHKGKVLRFRVRLFTLSLLLQNDFLAETIELLISQRGFFRKGYSDFIGRYFSPEDNAAVALTFIAVFVLVLMR